MDRRKRTFPKKYISMIAVAAFLALSVMTVYNMRTGSPLPSESKDTIGQAVPLEQETKEQEEEERERQKRIEELIKNDNTTFLEKEEKQDTEEIEEIQISEENTQDGIKRRQEAKQSFHYKGDKTLEWPLDGDILMPYSMDTTIYYTTLDQYACNDGILIRAKKGQEVVAAADGRIVNIMDTDRYGTLLTLLIGDHYEIGYGQIEHVKYEIGDEVQKGEVLGIVAEPSRAFTLEGPHVYVKLTYKNKPMNPVDYLK